MHTPYRTTTKALAVLAALTLGLAGTALFAKDKDEEREVRVEVHRSVKADSPWLGVYLVNSSEDRGPGVRIMSVIDDGPAQMAGLEDGDVIIMFNGVEIGENHKVFYEQFEGLKPNDEVEVIVLRDGDEEEFEVVLGERDTGYQVILPNKIKEMVKFGPGGHKRGFMGVHLQEITDDLREYFDVPEGEGVLISEVEDDSPAFDAGLKAGDVITDADGTVVKNAGDLVRVLADKEDGDPVDVTYYRDGRRDTITVNVVAREANVFDVNTMIWCGEGDDDCENKFSFGEGHDFSFSFNNEAFQESMGKLQEYFGSEDFQKRMQDSGKYYESLEKDLERKMKELEKKLQELEERLQELREEEEAGNDSPKYKVKAKKTAAQV